MENLYSSVQCNGIYLLGDLPGMWSVYPSVIRHIQGSAFLPYRASRIDSSQKVLVTRVRYSPGEILHKLRL